MRIPDVLASCVAFLLVETDNGPRYGGTAFFVSVPGSTVTWGYLVTAKHNIERAFAEHGSLSVRYNTTSGSDGYRLPPLNGWITHAHEAVDVAAIAFPARENSELHPVPLKMFATPQIVAAKRIGVGDDLFIPGLFRHRQGHTQNLPIVRHGTIASMDQELFQDQRSGSEYRGFLAEVHSFGGLSGSPVFVRLMPGRAYGAEGTELFLLGVIRGHWEAQAPLSSEFPQSEADGLNMGIAIVTPIDELVSLLLDQEEVRSRAKKERQWLKSNSPAHRE